MDNGREFEEWPSAPSADNAAAPESVTAIEILDTNDKVTKDFKPEGYILQCLPPVWD
jgi:hypothetical protein